MKKCVAIIPARMGATRFPGKPLADINGRPMVRRVYECAVAACCFDDVVVTAPDNEIGQAVRGFGGRFELTSSIYKTGSDRVAAVARAMDLSDDAVVVNVQGDYPHIHINAMQSLVSAVLREEIYMATLVKRLDADDVDSPDVVKANVDAHGWARDFSRKSFKHPCEGMLPSYEHIGIYAFRNWFLQEFSTTPRAAREKQESLEQLRVIVNGYKIKAVPIGNNCPSINTPQDLEALQC